MSREPYHTALASGRVIEDSAPVERFTYRHVDGRTSVALQHDVTNGPLPRAYDHATVLYAEPPWRAGYDRFNERAGIATALPWGAFLAILDRVIASFANRPVYLLVNKEHLRHLTKPDDLARVAFHPHGTTALLASWRAPIPALPDRPSNRDAQAALAAQHPCIGDPFAGYGSSVRAALRANRTFVASDHNARCIGFIAGNVRAWDQP